MTANILHFCHLFRSSCRYVSPEATRLGLWLPRTNQRSWGLQWSSPHPCVNCSEYNRMPCYVLRLWPRNISVQEIHFFLKNATLIYLNNFRSSQIQNIYNHKYLFMWVILEVCIWQYIFTKTRFSFVKQFVLITRRLHNIKKEMIILKTHTLTSYYHR